MNFGFNYESEEEDFVDLNIDEIAERLGGEIINQLEDIMLLYPRTAFAEEVRRRELEILPC
jgi:hypothetical protein